MKMQDLAKRNVGFTLIELMVVIAIIGILAAIAIPQYLTYSIRGNAMHAVSAIRPFQIGIAEFAAMRSAMPGASTNIPGIMEAAATTPNSTATGYVSCTGMVRDVVYDGTDTLTATFHDTASEMTGPCASANLVLGDIPTELQGNTVEFTANMNSLGVVSWATSGGTVSAKYRPLLMQTSGS